MTPMPSPQQNQNVAPQQTQPINKDVMDLVSKDNKPSEAEQLQKTKTQLLQVIKQQNLDPNKIVKAGDYALQILQNPKSWKQVTQQAIQDGIATPQDLQGEPNPQELVQIVASAKVVKKLILEGKV
jgi:hypothetical protein